MKRITAFSVIAALSVIVCGAALCEQGRSDRPREQERSDRPREQDSRVARPQAEEVRKLTERLRELNQHLRGPMEQARQNEEVRKAFARVRELQAALNEAQIRASGMLDMAVAQRNQRLVPLLRERNLIQKRLEQLRAQSGERRERSSQQETPRDRDRRPESRIERSRER